MFTIYNLLLLMHVLGLAIGVGSATVKLMLIFKCHSVHPFYFDYFKVSKLITKLIVMGTVILTFSGIGWLIIGYPLKMLLVVKLILVGLIWMIGPIIDNVVEPKLEKLMPVQGQSFSWEFIRMHKQHFVLEIAATILMYLTTIIGVML